jgi:hypothetical protein
MGNKVGAFADHLAAGTGPLGFPQPGIRNVGSYQVSGHPWITGSTIAANNKVHLIAFPKVCRSFTVINNNTTNGYDLNVHFQSGSQVSTMTKTCASGEDTLSLTADDALAGNHYITVPAGYASITFDVKCKQFFISNTSGETSVKYQVFADLTNIPTSSMYHVTGSGITQIDGRKGEGVV